MAAPRGDNLRVILAIPGCEDVGTMATIYVDPDAGRACPCGAFGPPRTVNAELALPPAISRRASLDDNEGWNRCVRPRWSAADSLEFTMRWS